MKILDVLEEVAAKRHLMYDDNIIIHISKTFMAAVLLEINEVIGLNFISLDYKSLEFKYSFLGEMYIIRNHKDNQNDTDVEEVMLQIIKKS